MRNLDWEDILIHLAISLGLSFGMLKIPPGFWYLLPAVLAFWYLREAKQLYDKHKDNMVEKLSSTQAMNFSIWSEQKKWEGLYGPSLGIAIGYGLTFLF